MASAMISSTSDMAALSSSSLHVERAKRSSDFPAANCILPQASPRRTSQGDRNSAGSPPLPCTLHCSSGPSSLHCAQISSTWASWRQASPPALATTLSSPVRRQSEQLGAARGGGEFGGWGRRRGGGRRGGGGAGAGVVYASGDAGTTAAAAAAAAAEAPTTTVKEVVLCAEELTKEGFAPFGQVVGPSDDGAPFGDEDASLKLDAGTPRFYIMRLPRRGYTFNRITHHKKVTQCLGGLGGEAWYMACVAAGETPSPDNIKAFRIPPGVFVKLHAATWHAGPYFDGLECMDFYNLELSDTNVVDHNNHYFEKDGLSFRILPPSQ